MGVFRINKIVGFFYLLEYGSWLRILKELLVTDGFEGPREDFFWGFLFFRGPE
jgi:hypothetical protein